MLTQETHREIDFILKKGSKITHAIQVSYILDEGDVRKGKLSHFYMQEKNLKLKIFLSLPGIMRLKKP